MPTLDEYLGGIFASLTQARMIADAQAVSAAETYARHDLLRHFAVPHLRFSEIELTIPVAIEAVRPRSPGGIDPDRREAVRIGILNGLRGPLGLRLLTHQAADILEARIEAALDRLVASGAAHPIEKSIASFATDLVRDIGTILPSIRVVDFDEAAAIAVAREVASAHIKEIAAPAGPGGLQVIAESHLLREQRPSDVIVIKMSISEEGMEWQNMEMSDGRTERKLLPE